MRRGTGTIGSSVPLTHLKKTSAETFQVLLNTCTSLMDKRGDLYPV